MYALLTPAGAPGLSAAARSNAAGPTSAAAIAAASAAGLVEASGATSASVAPAAGAVPSTASPTQRRLNFLLQASVHLSTKSPALSRVLQQQLQEVAKKHVLRLHASVKHSWCSSCFSLLLPHTATVRQFTRSKSCCSCSGNCSTAGKETGEVKAAKRESLDAPVPAAADDSMVHCSSITSVSVDDSNRSTDPCCPSCSNKFGCGCSGCSCSGSGPMRRRRRPKKKPRDVEGRHEDQPLMEVCCMVCGYVTRRP